MTLQHLLRYVLAVGAALSAPNTGSAQESARRGDMDALLGPATAIDQGRATRDEIAAALVPGPQHELLSRLVGAWSVSGHAGRRWEAVSQRAEVTELFGGSWFELRVIEDDGTSRIAHLGFDRYRDTFAMWEIGRGFTSPQARAGEARNEDRELHFWRDYTILRRGGRTPLHERVVMTLRDDGSVRWRSFERIGEDDERALGDVVFRREGAN